MSTALVVIDMQLGNFLEPYPVNEGSRLLKRVKGLLRAEKEGSITLKNGEEKRFEEIRKDVGTARCDST